MWGERVFKVIKNRVVIRESVYSCILLETRMTNAATTFLMRFFFDEGFPVCDSFYQPT